MTSIPTGAPQPEGDDRAAELTRARAQAEIHATTVLESMTDGFVLLDAGWRFVYVNAAFEKMNGVRRDDILGRDHWELYPATVGTKLEAEYRRVAREGVTVEFENHYEPWDRWFAVKAFPAAGGGICVQAREVTAAKRAAAELARREEELRAITDAVPALISYIDAGCVYRFVNRQYEVWFGRPREQVVGRHMREVLGAAAFEAVRPAVERALAGERFQFETFAPYKDGGGRHIHADYVPRVEGGRVVGYFALVADVTEQKRAEEALRHSEERLAQLIRVMPSFTAVLRGPEMVFELANAPYHALVGRGPEIIGKPVVEALPEIADQPFPVLLERVYRTGEPFEAKGMRVLLARGAGGALDELFVDFVYLPLRDADGAVSGILMHGVDRTVQARAEAALKDGDRRKDEFLATLAHELRNPLAPVRTGLAVLNRAPSLESTVRAREMMERQVGHMVRLIDDLLDVSRITRGKIELKRERVDVRSVLDDAVEASRPLIEAGRHALSVSVSDDPLPLDADPTRLAQVVANLLNNAAKYTPEGGRIELSAERDGGAAVIRVRDNGLGLAPEMLPRVFEMFTQVGRSIDRAQGGLGIGLALVARLVEMHGGSVAAESAGVGRGSTFVVRLPLAAGAARAGAVPAPKPPRVARRRILVVDDNVDGAESLADLLQLAGHATATAHTGVDALERARAFAPDVAFLDIGMPGMSGYELAQRLRGDAAFDGLVLVALTGWGTDDDRRRARDAGFDHHLTKPVDADRVDALLAATASGPDWNRTSFQGFMRTLLDH